MESTMMAYFLKGGPVMYPLLVCSLLSVAVVVERAFFWLVVDIRRNQPLAEEVLRLYRTGNMDSLQERIAASKNRVVAVLAAGILHRDFRMSQAMEWAAMEEMKRMRRFMPVLDTLITVAPMLGILGTVTGIISSFEMLGTSGIEHPQAVTAGIAEALITTAAGLIVAIFTVFPYNWLSTKIESAGLILESYATRLEIAHESLRNGGGAQETPA